MSFTTDDIRKIAHLAKLDVSPDEAALYTQQLSNILDVVSQMNQIDTNQVEAIAHPLDIAQRLRPDHVTEKNERSAFQAIAPAVEAGLYLVPQVIDAEG